MQVLIAGCGPAGLLLADALAQAGVVVGVVAPNPEAPWDPVYGDWHAELTASGLAPYCDRVWSAASLWVPPDREIVINRAYARVDGRSLKAALTREILARGVRIIEGRVVDVVHRPSSTTVTLDGGTSVETELFVDATGQASRFLEGGTASSTAHQTAYGVEVRAEDVPFDKDRMVLMDYRQPPVDDGGPPGFCYAMPLADDRWFFEETILIGRPAFPVPALQRRLEARLSALGIRTGAPLKIERCLIPMDPPLPNFGQRTLGFGAAAALVHPATGYQLATAARRAPRVASTVAALVAEGASGAALSAGAWRAVWTPDEIRARGFLRFGAEVLAELDAAGLHRFFAAFFAIPTEEQRAYLSLSSSSAEVARAMWAVFVRLEPSLKLRLMAALGRHGGDLAADLAGGKRIGPRT